MVLHILLCISLSILCFLCIVLFKNSDFVGFLYFLTSFNIPLQLDNLILSFNVSLQLVIFIICLILILSTSNLHLVGSVEITNDLVFLPEVAMMYIFAVDFCLLVFVLGPQHSIVLSSSLHFHGHQY